MLVGVSYVFALGYEVRGSGWGFGLVLQCFVLWGSEWGILFTYGVEIVGRCGEWLLSFGTGYLDVQS